MNIEERVKQRIDNHGKRFEKFGLKINPFPKSGTANTNESSDFTKLLAPIDPNIKREIENYVIDSLFSEDNNDQKLICTITGDYGTGKTQLLLYAKWLIQALPKNAYVIYINNPETKLSELIGAVIEHIGQEQFKKYLWGQILNKIKDTNSYKKELLEYVSNIKNGKVGDLFSGDELISVKNPFSVENEVSHKAFLQAFLDLIPSNNDKKNFNNILKQIITQVLLEINENDSVIANYFYNLISEDFGVNKTWETITSGNGLYLDSKVVKLLNAIINIIQSQGFERFYILVDEFEDITSGRLAKKEVDNYSHNLRTLIDKERRWCLLIAMTSAALKDLKLISPPLVDRLTDREIKIERLTDEQAKQIFINYLNIAREEKNIEPSTFPFTEEAIYYINSKSEELPRLLLRRANFLLERASELLNEKEEITKDFAKQQLED
jgi:Cdc6-like AAA superfamily ATPase